MAKTLLLNGHFKEHAKRRSRLVNLIKKQKRKEIKYLRSVCLGQKTIRNLSNEFGVTYTASRLFIRNLIKKNLVKKSRSKAFIPNSSATANTYELTEKGGMLLKALKENDERNALYGQEIRKEDSHFM